MSSNTSKTHYPKVLRDSPVPILGRLTLNEWAEQLPRNQIYEEKGEYSLASIQEKHQQQVQQPVDHDALYRALHTTNTPSTFTTNYRFYTHTPMTDEQWHNHVTKPLPHYPKRGFSLESHFLREAGSYPHPASLDKKLMYTPCYHKEKCIASRYYMSISGLERPIILACCLDQEEWDAIQTNPHTVETKPNASDSNLCVLCHRYRIELLHQRETVRLSYHGLESEVLQPSLHSKEYPFDFEEMKPLQFYYNPRNEPLGYDEKVMMESSHIERHNVTFINQPVVSSNLALLYARRNIHDQYFIIQDVLAFHSSQTNEPKLGENTSVYLTRVHTKTNCVLLCDVT